LIMSPRPIWVGFLMFFSFDCEDRRNGGLDGALQNATAARTTPCPWVEKQRRLARAEHHLSFSRA
jgi:hypothetical protein